MARTPANPCPSHVISNCLSFPRGVSAGRYPTKKPIPRFLTGEPSGGPWAPVNRRATRRELPLVRHLGLKLPRPPAHRRIAVTDANRALRDLFLAPSFARHVSPPTTPCTRPNNDEAQDRIFRRSR
jgi:hypothetical protein